MKIKICQSLSDKKVEIMVNEFICQDTIEVVELKYAQTQNSFSVMIVYNEK